MAYQKIATAEFYRTITLRTVGMAALVTVTDFKDAADLINGEAQQIYPEIWRHLDDARRALKAAGRDTAAFDHLRKHELVQVGVTDVESSVHLDWVRLFRVALDGSNFDHLTSQRCGRFAGSGSGIRPSA